MKKVLILSGSPRKGGNSDILCDQFAKGAREAGNEVEKIRVADKKMAPCRACYYCRDHGGIANWRTMQWRIEALSSMGVPTEFYVYSGLGHGFGLGTGTVAEGWFDLAVNFWERNR